MPTDDQKQQIIIIGGGFAGLEAAFTLKNTVSSTADITLIDRNPYHFFIPSIHEILSGKVKQQDIRIPLRTVLVPSGINFVQDEVQAIDQDQRQIRTASAILNYDYALLCLGAENNYFNIPGAAETAYQFRSPDNAERIRAELDRILPDPSCRCTVMIAGGGSEGLEVAGELIDAIEKDSPDDALRSGRIAVKLVEGKDRLLPEFPSAVCDFAERYLIGKGITLIAGSRIVEVRRNSVMFDTGFVHDVSLLIWTGGIQPPALLRSLLLPKDPSGWLRVTDRLTVPGDERLYGIGDAVCIYQGDEPLRIARLAYHAQDQAHVAALNIAAQLGNRPLVAYVPKRKPQLVSMGKDMGLYLEEEQFRSGAWVVAIKKAIEKKYLLTILSRPVSAAVWSKVPGGEFLNRLRLRRSV